MARHTVVTMSGDGIGFSISKPEYQAHLSALLPLWGMVFAISAPLQWLIPHFLIVGVLDISVGALVRSVLIVVYTLWAIKQLNYMTLVQAVGRDGERGQGTHAERVTPALKLAARAADGRKRGDLMKRAILPALSLALLLSIPATSQEGEGVTLDQEGPRPEEEGRGAGRRPEGATDLRGPAEGAGEAAREEPRGRRGGGIPRARAEQRREEGAPLGPRQEFADVAAGGEPKAEKGEEANRRIPV